jgi:dihydrofolate reductase
MRKIIVYIATSADGYISRPDGDVDWLSRPSPKGNYGLNAFYKSIDTVLMGRKTYEKAIELGQECYPGKRNIVFSRRRRRNRARVVEFVSRDVRACAKELRASKGKNIWLLGGAALIASFLDARAIDEFIIHIVPIMIGAGIPLIQPKHRSVPLKLRACRRYPDGVVGLHYVVRW